MAQKKEYTASEKVRQAQAAVEAHESAKPETFSSAYDGALRQVMDRILNREDFHYNLAGDALYRQYRNQAVQNGRLAMEDTLGRAAALTGGYGNSYAQSAGQQAYHRELDTLADRIPELYNLAMGQYQLQSQSLRQKYDLLSGAKQQEYQQYQDGLSAWQKEAEQLWQRYTDARDSDYDAYRDEVADWKWQQEYDEDRRRYDQAWEAEHPQLLVGGVGGSYSGSSGSSSSKKSASKETKKQSSAWKPLGALVSGLLMGKRLKELSSK